MVTRAIRAWASSLAKEHPQVTRVAYFGSYARGDWGVGSDLDLLVITCRCDRPFLERSLDFDTLGLPVPADLLIYTEEEWERLQNTTMQKVAQEAIWVYPQ
jgi:predicted nucleotidyltransferase